MFPRKDSTSKIFITHNAYLCVFHFKATHTLLIRVRAKRVTSHIWRLWRDNVAYDGKLISVWYLICTAVNSWWLFSEPCGWGWESQSWQFLVIWRWVEKRRRWRWCLCHGVQSRTDHAPTSSVFFSLSSALLAGLGSLTLASGWEISLTKNCKTALFQDGNPELLIYPTNSTGQICGQGENAEKPFLFFQNLLVCASMSSVVNGCPTPQVFNMYLELAFKF